VAPDSDSSRRPAGQMTQLACMMQTRFEMPAKMSSLFAIRNSSELAKRTRAWRT